MSTNIHSSGYSSYTDKVLSFKRLTHRAVELSPQNFVVSQESQPEFAGQVPCIPLPPETQIRIRIQAELPLYIISQLLVVVLRLSTLQKVKNLQWRCHMKSKLWQRFDI